MADMTTKHHRLIRDAVVQGATMSMENERLKTFFGDMDNCINVSNMKAAVCCVANCIITQLGNRLRYTHDRFDHEEFVDEVRKEVRNRVYS